MDRCNFYCFSKILERSRSGTFKRPVLTIEGLDVIDTFALIHMGIKVRI